MKSWSMTDCNLKTYLHLRDALIVFFIMSATRLEWIYILWIYTQI